MIPNQFKDCFNNCSIGYSFIYDKANELLQFQIILLEHIRKSPGLRDKFMLLQGDDFEWKISKVEQWIQSCDAFMKYLLTLIHISSGMPARAPELSFTAINNTIASDRSIYVYDKDIMLVQVFFLSSSQ